MPNHQDAFDNGFALRLAQQGTDVPRCILCRYHEGQVITQGIVKLQKTKWPGGEADLMCDFCRELMHGEIVEDQSNDQS